MTSRASLTTPIFIICRDQVTHLRELTAWLEKNEYENLIFVDNASSYGPLLKFLEETPHEVVRLKENLGARRCLYETGVYEKYVPGAFYAVSDADIVPDDDCPGDAMDYFRWALDRFPEYLKAGFGLRIDDLPDRPNVSAIVAWEEQFWRRPLIRGVYEAGIATTFALNRSVVKNFVKRPSLRTGSPYVARHMPWYGDPLHPSSEEIYCRDHIDLQKSHWTVPDAGLEAGAEVTPFTPLDRLRWALRARFTVRKDRRYPAAYQH